MAAWKGAHSASTFDENIQGSECETSGVAFSGSEPNCDASHPAARALADLAQDLARREHRRQISAILSPRLFEETIVCIGGTRRAGLNSGKPPRVSALIRQMGGQPRPRTRQGRQISTVHFVHL